MLIFFMKNLDANGTHKPWTIFMKKGVDTSIMAQELVEEQILTWKVRNPIMVLSVLAMLYALFTGAIPVLAIPVWLMVSVGLTHIIPHLFMNSLRRDMELMGQAVESEWKEQNGYIGYPYHENAKQLTRYGQFKGWSESKILSHMLTKKEDARKWITKNKARVLRREADLKSEEFVWPKFI